MPTLDFKGKQFVYAHHLSVPFRELKVDAKKSLPAAGAKPDLDDNLIIHGDNLHALKALLPQYAGKIKCIYIDPPYNTGNEGWCYNDNVRGPLIQEWLKDSANPVDKEDLERHDKWLCVMWPRLQLLKELLAEDGAIFISIDENELHRLLGIMDEIFSDNHVATIPIVNNMKGRNDKSNISLCHEYLVVYSKGKFVAKELPLTENQKKKFKNKDENGDLYELRDLRKRGGADTRDLRPKLYFPIYYNKDSKKLSLERTSKSDIEIFPIKSDGTDGCWRWGKKNVGSNLHILEASYVSRNDKWNVSYRVYLNKDAAALNSDDEDDSFDDDYDEENEEYNERTSKPKSFWWGPELSTDTAGKQLKKILGKAGADFDHPKSAYFLRRILYMATGENDLILDSFAGSGTTAQAVLALNKEDGGKRKFILVECEDYADKITAERVRRVIKGVKEVSDQDIQAGLGGSFSYCTLGQEINIDSLLKGDDLPDYEALARYVFYTATGKTLEKVSKPTADWFIGETGMYNVHLIYKPDVEFLRGNDSALNADLVTKIQERGKGKRSLVFATAKFMGQKELSAANIDFCQLPYAIHRILGE